VIKGNDPDKLRPLRVTEALARQHVLADEIRFGRRDHLGKAEISRNDCTVNLAMGYMAFFDPEHAERLDPIGLKAVVLAGDHQRIGDALAVTCGHRKFIGKFP